MLRVPKVCIMRLGDGGVPDEGGIATPGHYTILWAAAAY